MPSDIPVNDTKPTDEQRMNSLYLSPNDLVSNDFNIFKGFLNNNEYVGLPLNLEVRNRTLKEDLLDLQNQGRENMYANAPFMQAYFRAMYGVALAGLKGILPHNQSIEYPIGGLVYDSELLSNGIAKLYLSKIEHNTEPLDNTDAWVKVSGAGGGSARIGQLEFYYAPLVFEDNEVPDRIEFNGQAVQMSSYPDLKFWLKQHPEFFVSSKAQYDAIKNASATGQVGYFCWVDNTKQAVYMPIINDITFLQSLPVGAIQPQEVPTGYFDKHQGYDSSTAGAFSLQHIGGNTGGSNSVGTGNEKMVYDPYLAQQADPTRGFKNYAPNGKNVRQEAVRAYIYIVAIQGETQTNFFFKTKAPVQDYSYLPTAEQGAQEQDARKCVNSITIDNVLYPDGMYVYIDGSWQLYGQGTHTITSPFCLGFSVKSKTDLASLLPTSWCKSDALPKSGATYQSLYDKLVDVDTNGTAGTITKGGTTYNTKEKDGFVVVSSTDWNAIFTATKSANVFGLDTTNQEFYLPYNKPERTLIDCYYDEADPNDSKYYELYSDGLLLQGGKRFGISMPSGGATTIALNYPYDNTNYYPEFTIAYSSAWNGSAPTLIYPSITSTSFAIGTYNAYEGYTWQTRGYVNVPAKQQTYYDYYYVGDTIQSNSVINV